MIELPELHREICPGKHEDEKAEKDGEAFIIGNGDSVERKDL